MSIHIVRKPFMCRTGQFEPGERNLCIGILLEVLMKEDMFRFYIGNNRKVLYTEESEKINEYITEKRSFWRNPAGKIVAIVPVSLFKDHYETLAGKTN